jgi:hypothetical protein
LFQPSDHSKQSRFAATGGANDDQKFAVVDLYVDIAEGRAAAEAFGDPDQFDRSHRPPPFSLTP